MEPLAANMGVVPPDKDFLWAARKLTREYGSLLVFDEVVTGFRLGLGGAQAYYGVEADIIVLGKIVGGGFPIGAVVSSKSVMENLAPQGRVFNAGTFNAHPITMAAGLATIRVLESGSVYKTASRAAAELSKTLGDSLGDSGLDFTINRVESMFQVFFTEGPVRDLEGARRSRRELYETLHRSLLEGGVFIAPSNMEAVFTGAPHEGEALEKAVETVKDAVLEVKRAAKS
jgi:glutamate-1-semialdehyde 2,1-aminomutase